MVFGSVYQAWPRWPPVHTIQLNTVLLNKNWRTDASPPEVSPFRETPLFPYFLPKHTVMSQPVRPLHPGVVRVRLVPTPTLAYRAGRWHSLFILVEILREGLSLTSQDCLEEGWAQEKLYSSFMTLCILRSVPELYRNSKWVNKERTLVGKSQGPCRKAKLFDRSLKQTLLWEIICMSWWRDSVF